MTIANELSSEVAAALLEARKQESPTTDARNIREVIVAVHSTLRKLKMEARRAATQSSRAAFESGQGGNAASGSR
ncbi:MAG: hypothetical protein LC731_03005 [Acidobacteria bacterium]|nr:hypothetical protein [Acidobacteriota bacterium]